FINTGLNALGPGELSKLGKLGEQLALKTTERAVAKLGTEVLLESGEKVAIKLVDDAPAVLAKELEGAAATAFAHGGGTIENEVLDNIVEKVVAEGATDMEKAAVRKVVVDEFAAVGKETLEVGLKDLTTAEGMAKVVKNVGGKAALEVTTGYASGFVSGAVGAGFHLDPNLSFSENMANMLEAGHEAGKMGAIGALALGTVFKVAGHGWRFVKSGFSEALGKEAGQLGRNLEQMAVDGEYAVFRPKNAKEPKGKLIPMESSELSRVGDSNFYVDGTGKIYQSAGEAAGGKINVRL